MSDSLQLHALCSPWNSPGQNTGVGSCSLLWEPWSPTLQADSLPDEPQGKPYYYNKITVILIILLVINIAISFSRGSS